MDRDDSPHRYKILSGRNSIVLAELVNKHLEQGFQLVGQPYFGDKLHFQAVILPIVTGSCWELAGVRQGLLSEENTN
jgi:hypothetical protein